MLVQVGSDALTELRTLFEGFVTTESRIAASALLLILGLVVGLFVLPLLLIRFKQVVADRLFDERVAEVTGIGTEYVPTPVGGLVMRLIQAVVLFITVNAILVVWGLTDVVRAILRRIGQSVPLIGQSMATLGLLLGTYIILQILADTIDQFSVESKWVTEHQEEILLRVSQLIIFIIAGLATLTIWQVDLSGLLVGAGFLGIVVGLAARQTLGSMIAGFLLMFSRPFTIGDWIVIGDQEGVVTNITIFNTRLENFDGESVIIPNDKVSERAVVNRSHRGGLRLKVDVGIDYEADPEYAETVAIRAIKSVDIVTDAPPPQVIPKSFGDSAVVLELRFWIDNPSPPRKWQAVSGVVRTVKSDFEDAGIKIPFPQRELSGRAETGGFRVHGDGLRADAPEAGGPSDSD